MCPVAAPSFSRPLTAVLLHEDLWKLTSFSLSQATRGLGGACHCLRHSPCSDSVFCSPAPFSQQGDALTLEDISSLQKWFFQKVATSHLLAKGQPSAQMLPPALVLSLLPCVQLPSSLGRREWEYRLWLANSTNSQRVLGMGMEVRVTESFVGFYLYFIIIIIFGFTVQHSGP